jgi:hypothetical protein
MTRAFNFGAKIAASMCSPCDTPNSASNKKHMTGASPAVTEAGEKSEEIGKPEVVETEHSEAEAKQPEEGVKSAAKKIDPKAVGSMFSRMFGAAKPATTAVPAAASKIKIAPSDIANRFGTGKQIASPALPPTAPKVKISPAEAAAGRAAVKITPQDIAASAGNGMVGGKWTGAESINPANVPIPRGQMRPNGFSESDIRAAQGANLQPVRRSTGTDTMRTLAGPQGPAAPPLRPVPPRQ